jgi:hypothetical protein
MVSGTAAPFVSAGVPMRGQGVPSPHLIARARAHRSPLLACRLDSLISPYLLLYSALLFFPAVCFSFSVFFFFWLLASYLLIYLDLYHNSSAFPLLRPFFLPCFLRSVMFFILLAVFSYRFSLPLPVLRLPFGSPS